MIPEGESGEEIPLDVDIAVKVALRKSQRIAAEQQFGQHRRPAQHQRER